MEKEQLKSLWLLNFMSFTAAYAAMTFAGIAVVMQLVETLVYKLIVILLIVALSGAYYARVNTNMQKAMLKQEEDEEDEEEEETYDEDDEDDYDAEED